ncbi:MAG TPA: hypothetical protein PK335_02210, partial [Draconibacterium sp.]|nr:hypothetical protein [Draconibacterium sp.]
MPIQQSFRRKIFYYFIAVFLLFTVAILLYQLQREKNYKAGQLENTLRDVAEVTHNYIEHFGLMNSGDFNKADTLKVLIP